MGMSKAGREGRPSHDGDNPGGGEIDRYLDEMFDRLAGTGAEGRRALAETEDHLRTAAADDVAQGLPVAAAERDAVTRFGPPALIAGQLRRAGRSGFLWSVLSGAWILAGLGLLVLALTYLAKAVELAVLMRIHPQELPSCSDLQGVYTPPGTVIACTTSVQDMRTNAMAGLVVLVITAAVLLVRQLVVRRVGLASPPRRFPLLVAGWFAILGFLFVVTPVSPYATVLFGVDPGFFGVPMGMGVFPEDIAAAGSLLTAIAALIWYLARANRFRGFRPAAPDRGPGGTVPEPAQQ
jgi:hypothetical protein